MDASDLDENLCNDINQIIRDITSKSYKLTTNLDDNVNKLLNICE